VAYVTQGGTANTANVDQSGVNQMATVQQFGAANSATVLQQSYLGCKKPRLFFRGAAFYPDNVLAGRPFKLNKLVYRD
jgi:hypothetical protein